MLILTGNYTDYTSINYKAESSIYEYALAYNSFIENTIDNELVLSAHLNSYLNESVFTEAANQTVNKIKQKCERLKEFIKNLIGKFIENLKHLFSNEQKYLERYKDIIIDKKPKDIEYSYNGDFAKGMER